MENPFELILNKLSKIEQLVIELKKENDSKQKHDEFHPQFLTIAQAAEFLHIAKQTIYGLTSSREIPHYKTGKKIYFKRLELDAWITKNRVATREHIEDEASQWLLKKAFKNRHEKR